MTEFIRKRPNIIVAIILGLCAWLIVVSEIHFTIPGTNIITDPREVFVTIGAALTGPVGGIIIGLLSSIYDPTPDLRFYVMLQHIVGAVFIGFVYKRYLFEKMRMPFLLLGWMLAMFFYYYVVYIPLYFLVSITHPELFNIITLNSSEPLDSLIRIFEGWIPEAFFTTLITSLILIALPRQFRKPIWGRSSPAPLVQKAEDNFLLFLRRLLSGNFLGLRLAIWYLLLSLLPFFVIRVFIQNNVSKSFLQIESERLYKQVVSIADLSSPESIANDNGYYILDTNDYHFLITELQSDSNYSNELIGSIYNTIIKPIEENLGIKSNGVFLSAEELLCAAYALIPETEYVIVSYIDQGVVKNQLDELETKSTLNIAISLVMIAGIAGVVIWFMIVIPLKTLKEASERVGRGNYDFSIDQNKMVDELALLGNSFNEMTRNVKKAYLDQQKEMEVRIKAEKERYEFEKELYYITENILDVIIQTDNEGKIIYASPSIEKTFGFSKEYTIGKDIFDFLHPEDQESFRDSFSQIINKYSPSLERFKHRHADGFYISVESIGNPILDDELNISTIIFTLRDVTDNIEYQESLKKAKDAAEKSDKIKTEFLAQMSHEIRTPVNTILNFAYLLQEEVEDQLSDEMKDGFKIIERGSNRLIRTIDSILNLSQLQFGTMDIHKAYVDLYEIVEKVYQEFEHLASAKNIEIKIYKECTDCNVYIDMYTVTQLVANLVDNAIKYTKKGCIEIRIYQDSEDYNIDISDTGIGMTKEYLEKIFEPFSQEESGYTRRFEGTGLGLALVKKYCEINKADISVESEKNKGTRFTIRFKNRKVSGS